MKKINIGIIGLGYVGLPLAIEFGKVYKTVGYDIDMRRINDLKKGYDKTLEVPKKSFVKSKKLNFTNEIKELEICNVFIVTVPTPVSKDKSPNLKPILNATMAVAKILKKNDIVIYESTVYPGLTEEYCAPLLQKESNLIFNKDFFCGYSPERINPGDKDHTLTSVIKLTSGSNSETADFVDNLYSSIIKAGTFKVSSIAVAEAAKVIENTQRDVNIALMNELAIIFNRCNLNTNEVLKAANTKWNFLPFSPGLVGGHCIGVDPYYLTFKSLKVGYKPEIILAGRKINDDMSKYIAGQVIHLMQKKDLSTKKSKIALFGLTFKENCPDIRNTKAVGIYEELINIGCQIRIADEYADKNEAKIKYGIELVEIEQLDNIDVAIIAVAHDKYRNMQKKDWLKIISPNALVFDIKSIMNVNTFKDTKVSYWSL